jgi:C-terminal processing protease CtpA/Prc
MKQIVENVIALVREHYVFPDMAIKVGEALAAGLAEGRYGTDVPGLAEAVTADLQSVNGDKHLRLLHHVEPLPDKHGEDETDLATVTAWAEQTFGGVARAERLPGNVGYIDLQPILFPAAVCGDTVAAAMNLVAPAAALILDLRRCLGGEPGMVAFLCSYLFGPDPVELSGLYQRRTNRTAQSWTLPYVPGRRFGVGKPVYVLTSATTFSGGEQLAYDLRQLNRATVVGERTRGGAHAREGFKVHPHLEATIPVARAVNPITGGNWEGTGVAPHLEVSAEQASEVAYQAALQTIIERYGESAAEARQALAAQATDAGPRRAGT